MCRSSEQGVILILNQELARVFYDMANELELEGVPWKPIAYRKAARAIETLSRNIREVWELGQLEEIPGVGEGIAKKIEEYIKTGRIQAYEDLKRARAADLSELLRIPGMGPKKAKRLYNELGIATIDQLEAAATAHRISSLKGFGKESEANILEGIALLRSSKGRFLLSHAWVISQNLVEQIQASGTIDRVMVAGSLRRMKETIGDIDILATAEYPEAVMDAFTTMPEVKMVFAKGPTKATIVTKTGVQADLRVVAPQSWGAALLYFTGSKEHNISLRGVAMKKGYKLNEYGLFKGDKAIARKTEEEVYHKLGFSYIPPELRENRGELKAARKNQIPKLVTREDIVGDLHVHTKWSDGVNSLEEMAFAAKSLGYEYLGICDHSKSQTLAHGLDADRLFSQIARIEEINKAQKGFRLLKGCEVDIKSDGSLDFPDEVLKHLDFVTAAVHSGFKMTRQAMTARLATALENKYVKILAHPTGRLLQKRAPYEVDLEAVFQVAAEHKIIMEINAHPARLDLGDTGILQALDHNLTFSIGTDAHSVDQLNLMQFGIAQARRGWLTAPAIINTTPLIQLLLAR